ncbi:MAG: cytochrome c peroxidase [Bacteroidota bacterium]
MKNKEVVLLIVTVVFCVSVSFKRTADPKNYLAHYNTQLLEFNKCQSQLLACIEKSKLTSPEDIEEIRKQVNLTRDQMKGLDFWMRYLEPISYKQINGPLPVEWETEVFEKFEAPYKREGAGLTLAGLYLDEEQPDKKVLFNLVKSSDVAAQVYMADSITRQLTTPDHFYLCNRLFLLNLAAIYTTGFECPDTSRIIPELKGMLTETYKTYASFNGSFPNNPLPENYLELYRSTVSFVSKQDNNYLQFDHFTFIKEYINPLFSLNQKLIKEYKVVSKSNVDYSLNKNSVSIFSKDLYRAQNTKGIYLRVYDKETLAEIEKIGKLLFYDPVLSGNNLRSCASCHNPNQYFTDTIKTTSLHFDGKNSLPRNSPSLINSEYNHLVMLDGKHTSLQNQAKDVITNASEMACAEDDVLKKILSCEEYKTAFKKFLKFTPTEKKITIEHVTSALTLYYSKFSHYYSEFDKAMNQSQALSAEATQGFNVFMGKAQCATCHFVPQFNGVKPPYVGSEFEVLGVPKDSTFKQLSADKGRYVINPASEMASAFRTGSVRNAEKTKPYMHNGSFTDLNQVIDFYDAGGGTGRGLKLDNQTLSGDSLHLTKKDKKNLLAFIKSLNEDIMFEKPPEQLPKSKIKQLNKREVGGEY